LLRTGPDAVIEACSRNAFENDDFRLERVRTIGSRWFALSIWKHAHFHKALSLAA
jgi:hypothetical protein